MQGGRGVHEQHRGAIARQAAYQCPERSVQDVLTGLRSMQPIGEGVKDLLPSLRFHERRIGRGLLLVLHRGSFWMSGRTESHRHPLT